MDDPAGLGQADPAGLSQVDAVEVAPPMRRRLLVGALEEDSRYRVRRTGGSEDWLLLHTVTGAGIVRDDQGGHLVTAPGAGVLLAPGTFQDYGTDPAAGRWHLLYAHLIAPPAWQVLLDWPQALPGIGRIDLGSALDARVREQLRSAARAMRMSLGHPELFAMNGVEAALLWYDTRNPRRRLLDERILRVLEHVDAHLAEDLDVSALAEVAHLSSSRFAHLFREQLDVSVVRYLEMQRMELAGRLLEMTGQSVAEVARKVGYTDPLYFSHRFRRCHGLSPTAFRRQRRVGGEWPSDRGMARHRPEPFAPCPIDSAPQVATTAE